MLITGGGKDHQVPEAVTRQAYELYAGSHAITDYHVFPDRGHSLVFDSGWRKSPTTPWTGSPGIETFAGRSQRKALIASDR